MSDYNDETAFLRRMLLYDESIESRKMEECIARVQRERACVLRAASTMALLAILSSLLSQVEFFQSEPTVRLRVVCVAGLAALICFVAFVSVLILYRTKLNRLREECRGLIGKLVETQITRRTDFLVLSTSAEPAPDGQPVLGQLDSPLIG